MSDTVISAKHFSEIMHEYVEELEFKYQNPGKLCEISTGMELKLLSY